MQAGFEAASYLGTPLAEPLPSPAAAAVRGGLSQQIFENSLQFPDMSVSERNIVYRKQPPMLQGMNLSRVPTGGFPSTPASIIVGAGVNGVEYNTRMPALFSQPSDPGRRVEIAPVAPLTGENGGETVYRAAGDAVTRQKRGAMTIRRAEQEAAIARKKQRASLAKMLALPSHDSVRMDTVTSPSAATTYAPISTPSPSPLPAQAVPVYPSYLPSYAPMPALASSPTAVLAELGSSDDESEDSHSACAKSPKAAMTDFFASLQKSAGDLHTNTRHLITGKLTWEAFVRQFMQEQHWILVGVAVTVLLVLVILVVVIVMAARPKEGKQTAG